MKRIPIDYINKWFDDHQGDVFRCYQARLCQSDIKEKPKWMYYSVFIVRIKNYFYVAYEVDIFANGLGEFYRSIGMGNSIPKKVDNYIRVYSQEDYLCKATFTALYRTEKDLNDKQDMPWFSDDVFNRTKFLADVYKCIDNSN